MTHKPGRVAHAFNPSRDWQSSVECQDSQGYMPGLIRETLAWKTFFKKKKTHKWITTIWEVLYIIFHEEDKSDNHNEIWPHFC